jgi:hypothetical protein
MSDIELIITLVILVGCGVATAVIAGNKGREPVMWFFVGFFFGILGVILISVSSDEKRKRQYRLKSSRTNNQYDSQGGNPNYRPPGKKQPGIIKRKKKIHRA